MTSETGASAGAGRGKCQVQGDPEFGYTPPPAPDRGTGGFPTTDLYRILPPSSSTIAHKFQLSHLFNEATKFSVKVALNYEKP